ncbi:MULTISPECIES: hypothetical protein [Flavobacterium]|uniref:hypothetical protein n=1 Tax=Flavobacterium TaxID=237 RepID=UPI001454D545|nr:MULTISPECIES: hypothetical protein [Flavobacterium]
MKKLMLVAVMVVSTAMAFAQTAPAKTVTTKKHQHRAKTEVKAEPKKGDAKMDNQKK